MRDRLIWAICASCVAGGRGAAAAPAPSVAAPEEARDADGDGDGDADAEVEVEDDADAAPDDEQAIESAAPRRVRASAAVRRAAAPRRPRPRPRGQISVDVAEEIGVISTTHTTVTAAYAHRLWGDRLYVEGRLGLGSNGTLAVIEERVGAGLVLRPGKRVELLVGWRLGDTYMFGQLNAADFGVHLLAVELSVLLAVELRSGWRLRVEPLAPTVFWNGTYGGSIGLELGIGHAF